MESHRIKITQEMPFKIRSIRPEADEEVQNNVLRLADSNYVLL